VLDVGGSSTHPLSVLRRLLFDSLGLRNQVRGALPSASGHDAPPSGRDFGYVAFCRPGASATQAAFQLPLRCR